MRRITQEDAETYYSTEKLKLIGKYLGADVLTIYQCLYNLPECKGRFKTRPINVKKGRTKSCGCCKSQNIVLAQTLTQKQAEQKSIAVGIKLIGKYVKNDIKTEFECPFCKKSFLCRPNSIFRKNTLSCGCNRLQGISQHFWKGGKYISQTYFNEMRRCAKRRNIEFNITILELENLLEQQNFKCKLSGLIINCSRSADRNYSTYQEQTASLDRIDSSKGYIIDNIQWVHKDVNNSKQDYNQDYFIELCNMIAKKHPKNV